MDGQSCGCTIKAHFVTLKREFQFGKKPQKLKKLEVTKKFTPHKNACGGSPNVWSVPAKVMEELLLRARAITHHVRPFVHFSAAQTKRTEKTVLIIVVDKRTIYKGGDDVCRVDAKILGRRNNLPAVIV